MTIAQKLLNRYTIGVTLLLMIGLLGYAKYPHSSALSAEALNGTAIVIIALLAFAIIGFGYSTDLLRKLCPTDFGLAKSTDGAPLRRPFSLALSQMAWWFFLVFADYIYLYVKVGGSKPAWGYKHCTDANGYRNGNGSGSSCNRTNEDKR